MLGSWWGDGGVMERRLKTAAVIKPRPVGSARKRDPYLHISRPSHFRVGGFLPCAGV